MSPLPREVHAVIFDMDGLLLDTERIYVAAIMGAGHSVGFEISEAFCHSMIGIPGQDCDLMIEEHFGPTFPMAEYQRQCSARIRKLIDAGIPLKTGAVELLDHLAEHNIPTAIATSSSRRNAIHNLQKSGLLERFHRVVTRDEVTRGKPSPDLYVKAAQDLDINPKHCLALEDSLNGVRAAYAAGTMPVMVPDILRPTDEVRAMCMAVLESLHDVRDFLMGKDRNSTGNV